jgi:hypothetical protein
VFLRDGFSVAAFLFAPIWMLAHVMLLAFAGYVLLGSALVLALKAIGAPVVVQWLVWPALNVLVAFEASSLRRSALVSRGWRDLGIVAGDYLEAAERRFYSAWVANAAPQFASSTPSSSPSGTRSAVQPRLRMQQDDVIGLFPKPGTSPKSGASH